MTLELRTLYLLESTSGISSFERWYGSLKDIRGKQAIWAKLTLLQDCSYKSYKSVGDGVFEVRVFLGPGYRIYFGLQGTQIVVLIAGGDKNSQHEDIKKAKALWNEFKNETQKYKRKFAL